MSLPTLYPSKDRLTQARDYGKNFARNAAHPINLQANSPGTADVGNGHVDGILIADEGIETSGYLELPVTTDANDYAGIVYKGAYAFLHDYHEDGSIGDNTFIGSRCGSFSMGMGGGATYLGSLNTGIGYSVLAALTTGYENVGIGNSALELDTTGFANTAIGAYSLAVNTIGNFNVGIGYAALSHNTSGVNNLAIGGAALIANTTGQGNLAMGFETLGVSTTGSQNTGIGISALWALLSGDNNLGLGSLAGYSITGGDDNVFIGTDAGHNALQKVDPTNSIAIGYNTYTTKDNQAVIGNASVTETVLAGTAIASGFQAGASPGMTTVITVGAGTITVVGGLITATTLTHT